jgi:hypothetical protein
MFINKGITFIRKGLKFYFECAAIAAITLTAFSFTKEMLPGLFNVSRHFSIIFS